MDREVFVYIDLAHQVACVVANWRGEAARLGVSAREIARMASAFEHEDARKALTLA